MVTFAFGMVWMMMIQIRNAAVNLFYIMHFMISAFSHLQIWTQYKRTRFQTTIAMELSFDSMHRSHASKSMLRLKLFFFSNQIIVLRKCVCFPIESKISMWQLVLKTWPSKWIQEIAPLNHSNWPNMQAQCYESIWARMACWHPAQAMEPSKFGIWMTKSVSKLLSDLKKSKAIKWHKCLVCNEI